jgi:hypothetical protein
MTLFTLPVLRMVPACFLGHRPDDAGITPVQAALSTVMLLLALTAADRAYVEGVATVSWFGLAAILWLPLANLGLLSLSGLTVLGNYTLLTELLTLHAIGLAAGRWLFLGDIDAVHAWNSVQYYWCAITTLSLWWTTCRDPRRARLLWIAWLLIAILPSSALRQVVGDLWYPPEEEQYADVPEDLPSAETLFAAQADLLDEATATLAPGVPGMTDHYFLALGGDAQQDVFREEALFARALFDQRFATQERSVVLVNAYSTWQHLPLATLGNLRAVLAAMAERMDRDEDVLFMYLTSHGSEEGELAISFGDVSFDRVDASALREALDDAGIQWRVLIVSACYSGSFIPALQTPGTLLMTAASADRASFGCSEERHFTYFGEALLGAYLNRGLPLREAFAAARQLIETRERQENLTPSQPQLWIGDMMQTRLDAQNAGDAWLEGGKPARRLPVDECVSCDMATASGQP